MVCGLAVSLSTSYWPGSVSFHLAPNSVHEIWLKTLGRTSAVIGLLFYQAFAYPPKGFREGSFYMIT